MQIRLNHLFVIHLSLDIFYSDVRVLNDESQHRDATNNYSNSYVTVNIAGVNTDLLIDTGAVVSVLTKSALNQL